MCKCVRARDGDSIPIKSELKVQIVDVGGVGFEVSTHHHLSHRLEEHGHLRVGLEKAWHELECRGGVKVDSEDKG